MRNIASLVFSVGLAFLLLVIAAQLGFGHTPMLAGSDILAGAAQDVGAANIVTAVVFGYRGFDTLGEISILFAAATAAGLVLGHRRAAAADDPRGGLILAAGAELLFPMLVLVGIYIVIHGHLTPGGGFQGGVVLAAAFFVAVIAEPSKRVNHAAISVIEGLAGAAYIAIGIWALVEDGSFLKPMLDHGVMGQLLSAGTMPLLSSAVGIKVGSELAGLLAHISESEAGEP
jgi:multicomponent Na+:H+ antiporter subunit B